MNMSDIIVPRIHPEGPKFVWIFAGITLVLFLIAKPLGWLGVVATIWCFYFFRDPDRHTPMEENLIICPADGVICSVGEATPPLELNMPEEAYLRICVFMNVFNCHVNRSPVDGEVVKVLYHPGQFLNASLDKASEQNERNSLVIRNTTIGDVGVVQIAGLVARRIVCDVRENTLLDAGERFGMIRFGSRVDVYVRKDLSALVSVGQTVIGGETVFADMRVTGGPRDTEVR